MDLDDVARVRSRATRIAAVLPLPAFLRRRFELEDANQLIGHHASLQWPSKVVTVLDPATVSTWPKAIAMAATVAVAGLGAGAAVGERDTLRDFVADAPAIGSLLQRPATHARDGGPATHSPGVRAPRKTSASAGGSASGSTGGAGTRAPVAKGSAPGPPAADGVPPAAGTPAGSEPARDTGAAAPVKGVGTTLPGTALPTDDLAADHVPVGQDSFDDVVDGVGEAPTSGAGASGPGTLGDVLSDAAEVSTPQGGSAGASVGAAVPDAGGSATTAAGSTTGTAPGEQVPPPAGAGLAETVGGGGAGLS